MTQEIEQQNEEIITLLGTHPEGLSRGQISDNLSFPINDKTLQRRLTALVDDSRIARIGERKATRYHPLEASIETSKGHLKDKLADIFSPNSQKKLKFLGTPLHAQKKCPITVIFWTHMSLIKANMSLKG